MTMITSRIALACLVAAFAGALLSGVSLGSGGGAASAATVRHVARHAPARRKVVKRAAKRCRVVRVRVRVRAHGAGHRRLRLVRRRVCKPVTRRVGSGGAGSGGSGSGGPVGGGLPVPPIVPPPIVISPPADPGEPGPGPGDGDGGSTGTGDPAPVYAPVDYVTSSDFEDADAGVGCFAPFSQNDGSVVLGSGDPIAGASSLVVSIVTYGRIGCEHDYGYHEGPIADGVRVEGDVRVDVPSSGGAQLSVCAVAYFEDENAPGRQCQDVGAGAGVVHVSVRADAGGRRLARVFYELDASGTAIRATIDGAHLYVDEVPGSGGPRGGGGSGGGGGGSGGGGSGGCPLPDAPLTPGPPDPASTCNGNATPRADGSYTPAALSLPAQRPYVSLADYSATGPIFTQFTAYVNRALGGNPDYGYTPAHAVYLYARTRDLRYITHAIAQVDASVHAAETAIAAGEAAPVAGDSYLEVGADIEQLALTYDYGFDRLTDDQKARWKAYGDQTISNVWNPYTASWGANFFPWSAWSINNPGNNYFFSFIKATQMWALATRSQPWIDFLQRYKFPLIANYYDTLPGGGSREGTGYGTAQRKLWEDARMWKHSTGEDLASVTRHARESIDYWVNATVPTLNYFAPIGDLSRESLPELYDYQENLVREAVTAAPGTDAARRGVWWLQNNSVPETLFSSFNLGDGLLSTPDAPQAPTALTYNATGVGQFFARNSWRTDATWLDFSAGPYDESHAHEDQGNFTLYRNTWLAVTPNIWSNSGLQGVGDGDQDIKVAASNVVRFTRLGGAQPQEIEQSFSSNTMTADVSGSGTSTDVRLHANLTDAYRYNSDAVRGWTRDVEFQNNTLHVHDTCSVGANVASAFQVNVPVRPTNNGNGTIDAGGLHIVTSPSSVVRLIDVTSTGLYNGVSDFSRGWRIDISNADGSCGFDVTLTAV